MADTNNTVTREQWLEGIAKLAAILQASDAFFYAEDKDRVLTEDELKALYGTLAKELGDRNKRMLPDGNVEFECPDGSKPCPEGCCATGIFPSAELPPQF